ncbi:MAG TPA: ArsC/Spx/MgsR family protein [candidate division Zixibacteria bacterium]|nr:ArsC/Spx/MgsR family protein [candidate division Zixibacteria bacterium]
MPSKRVLFLCYGSDDICEETRKFVEETGVMVDYRDMEKKPLSEDELSRLIGNLEISHFVNTLSESYAKRGLDKGLPPRTELIKMMAEDYTLIKRPIIKNTRLITVGFARDKIKDMLQLNSNGQLIEVQPPQRRNDNQNSKGNRRGSRQQAAAAGK